MSDVSWHHAALALKLLALDPEGLGGVVIRMRASPDRDRVLKAFHQSRPVRKLPITISDEQLLGGVDLAATLAAGRVVLSKGFFDTPCSAVVPMAERCSPALGAKLCQLMDQSLTRGIVALDEGIEADEATPESLADRLAFHIAPECRIPGDWPHTPPPPSGETTDEQEALAQLTVLASRFGISSLRAPLFAVNAARAHARLDGRELLTTTDVEVAAALVYPHRATCIPEAEAPEQETETPAVETETTDAPEQSPSDSLLPHTEMLINAVAALLPAGLLSQIGQTGKARGTKGSGDG